MSDQVTVTVEMRVNNTLFQCEIEKKFYNLKETKAYAVMALGGIVPTSPEKMTMQMATIIICEGCWKKEKDNKEGLNLKDPSNIIVPKPGVKMPDF